MERRPKRRRYYASDKTKRYIDYLLAAFGFKYRQTGRAYLSVRFKEYNPAKGVPFDLADSIIADLKESIISKGYNRTISLGRQEKKDNYFSVTDFADYIFCPHKAILKFKGFPAQKTKATVEGTCSHQEENILQHIDALRRSQRNFFKRTIISFSGRFSPEYKSFLKENLIHSEIIYSSEQTNKLLTYCNLGGKPDYIFRTPGGNILLELKFPYVLSETVYDSYKTQMYCYALLGHKNGIDIKKGFLIKYPKDKGMCGHPTICPPIEFNINEVNGAIGKLNNELSRAVKDMRPHRKTSVNLNKCVKCNYMYFCSRLFNASYVCKNSGHNMG